MPFDESESGNRTDVHATDVLANERTYLAYVRTALALIGFGFVIARFSLFTREFTALVHASRETPEISTGFGTAMAICGIFVALLGAWRYSATDRGLRAGRVVSLSSPMSYAVALFVAGVGAIAAFALLLYR